MSSDRDRMVEADIKPANRSAPAGGQGAAEPCVDDVEMLIRRIEHLMRTQGRAELADLGVTRDQFHVLVALCGLELTMGDLSARLGVAGSTVTDLVDRMERVGLVERVRDEADRRVIRVRITEGGKSVLNRVKERRRAYLGLVLGAMTGDEQKTLRDLLAKVHSFLASQADL